MPSSLVQFLLPGETLTEGVSATSVTWSGLNPGWALLAWIGLLALLVWSYRRYAPNLSRRRRMVLVALRAVLLGLLLILLARPTLNLEIEERTRRTLAVLIDTSQSMTLADGRADPADLQRAALATGMLAPSGGLNQSVPADETERLSRISRADLLRALAANSKLDLWSALHANADLEFFGFGRTLTPLGTPFSSTTPPSADDAAAFFASLRHEDNVTALGDSLREILDRKRGQSLAGVFLVTDGAGNTGAPPLEAARLASQDGVPLYVYGVGVTTPRDLAVLEVNGPQLAVLQDRAVFTTRIRTSGLAGHQAQFALLANGRKVDERTVEISANDEQEITFEYVPEELGEVAIEVTATALPGEMVLENNTAATTSRVVDTKVRILYIEGEPRWEFRYLLALLQRDRHLAVECVVLNGDPHLAKQADSVFLPSIPDEKNRLFTYDAIIIGDADPKAIGATRMGLIAEWAETRGGGLVFLAGPRFTPAAYRGSVFEKLLPVELDAASADSPAYAEPVQLKLTPAGERSMTLQLSDAPQENLTLWSQFPGVTWTARVGRARPAAQTLLADPTPDRASRSGPMPVIAIQPYGLGQIAFIGTDATYRWRSRTGERFHTRVWLQLIQSLTAARQRGGSQLTQLTADRARYRVGDRIVITGRAFAPDFTPLPDAALPGLLSIQAPASTEAAGAEPPQLSELRLAGVTGRPGDYRGEFVARLPGSYTFSVAHDEAALAQFEVVEPRVEFADTAMNEPLLRALVEAAGGAFLREEDLAGLPDRVASGATELPVFKTVDLGFSPWILGLLILTAAGEWAIRRRSELK